MGQKENKDTRLHLHCSTCALTPLTHSIEVDVFKTCIFAMLDIGVRLHDARLDVADAYACEHLSSFDGQICSLAV